MEWGWLTDDLREDVCMCACVHVGGRVEEVGLVDYIVVIGSCMSSVNRHVHTPNNFTWSTYVPMVPW